MSLQGSSERAGPQRVPPLQPLLPSSELTPSTCPPSAKMECPTVFSKFGNILAIVGLTLLSFLSRTPILHLLVVPQFTAICTLKKLFILLVFLFI